MATPALADQAVLATDPTFIGRVGAALVGSLALITNEPITTNTQLLHSRRAQAAVNMLNQLITNPTALPAAFALTVATQPAVISDATQAGVTRLTAANVATQQALVTDTDLLNAVSSVFNSYVNIVS